MIKKTLIFFISLWVGYFGAAFLPAYAKDPASDASSSQGLSATDSTESTTGIDRAIKTAQQEIRDPFAVGEFEEAMPDTNPEESTPIPPLEGIGFGNVDAYAVMGGDVYFKGDVKKGIKLLEVRRREVDIIVDGGKVTLALYPGDELKKAQDRAEKKKSLHEESEVE